ncbi:hypothetical protein Bbelb_032580 [Branchiostoma belcheri]|nr:hypothetical protein Bbelb_032580 [Branchiostoma belcheri]
MNRADPGSIPSRTRVRFRVVPGTCLNMRPDVVPLGKLGTLHDFPHSTQAERQHRYRVARTTGYKKENTFCNVCSESPLSGLNFKSDGVDGCLKHFHSPAVSPDSDLEIVNDLNQTVCHHGANNSQIHVAANTRKPGPLGIPSINGPPFTKLRNIRAPLNTPFAFIVHTTVGSFLRRNEVQT